VAAVQSKQKVDIFVYFFVIRNYANRINAAFFYSYILGVIFRALSSHSDEISLTATVLRRAYMHIPLNITISKSQWDTN